MAAPRDSTTLHNMTAHDNDMAHDIIMKIKQSWMSKVFTKARIISRKRRYHMLNTIPLTKFQCQTIKVA